MNKFLAQHLQISRRAADELIEKGKVRINDEPAALGSRVFASDSIVANGRPIQATEEVRLIYIAMHKPKGYVCSRKQQGDAPTIFSLLGPEYQHLNPVGRLDKDSSGILLLTNDGDFAHSMTHPSFKKTKQYEVTIDKPLTPLHRQMISDFGIQLADGGSKLHLERLREGDDTKWHVTMHEGRNRQIRRTFSALGYEVIRLHRTVFGPFTLDGLAAGAIKQLTP